MPHRVMCRQLLAALILLVTFQAALAQQSTQTITNAGSTSAGSTTTGDGARVSRRSSTGSDPQGQFQRRLQIFVTGSVVMSNGAPLPAGIVIERICQGRTTREAYVDPNGNFGFLLGAYNGLPDASSSDPAPGWNLPGMAAASIPTNDFRQTLYADCEFRAQLGGYRSSVIGLAGSQLVGQINLGTLFLYPATEMSGTMVSATELIAPKNAKKSLERAAKAHQRKNLVHAEGHLRAALAAYPKFASAWLRLGQVYREMCRIDEARQAFSNAVTADPHYVPAYIELTRLAVMERAWNEALDLSDHALKLDPLDFPAGFYLNAVANFNLNHLDAAETSARKAQRLDSRHSLPQIHLLIAGILHRRHDLIGEATQLRDYLKYAPYAADTGQVRHHLQLLEESRHR